MASKMGVHHFVKNLLKFTNAILLVLGLFMGIFSLYLLLQFKKEERAREEVDSPVPPPPPMTHHLDKEPWFLYAFGGAGVYIVITAAIGLLGAEHGNRCCLGMYTYQLGLMLLGQGALAIAIFTKNDFVKMPEDITGNEAKAWKFVHKNLPIVQYFSISVLAVQLLSVLLAIALRQTAKQLQYDSDDEEDYYERHYGSGPRTALLQRDEEGNGQGGRQDSWSRRMREKYGLDTTSFSYHPNESSAVSAPSQRAERQGGCNIM